MNIRPVTEKDSAEIIELVRRIWAEYDCVLEVETEECALLAPGDYFRAREGEFWVVEDDGRIVATVAVKLNDARESELKYLYVDQSQRKKGLGERLTNLAIDYARTKGAGQMVLWSDTRFTKAHRLYERLGFEGFAVRELDDLNKSIEYGFSKSLR